MRLALGGDLAAKQIEDDLEVRAQWDLHRDLRALGPVDDRGVADGIRGQFLVGDDEPGVVVGTNERVREPDLLDDALDSVDDDPVAEPQRLGERDQQAGREVAERLLRREADDEADHGARGEQRAGDRAHLGDHEQPRHQGDEDDRAHRPCGAARGSGSRPRRELAPAHAHVDELRQHEAGEHHAAEDR